MGRRSALGRRWDGRSLACRATRALALSLTVRALIVQRKGEEKGRPWHGRPVAEKGKGGGAGERLCPPLCMFVPPKDRPRGLGGRASNE